MSTMLLKTFVVSVTAGMVSCSGGGTATPSPNGSGGATSVLNGR